MSAPRSLLSALALLAAGHGLAAPAPGPAPAPPTVLPSGFHQICYQGPDLGTTLTAVVACRNEDWRGGGCRVTGPAKGRLVQEVVTASSHHALYALPTPTAPSLEESHLSTVAFDRGPTRPCTVHAYLGHRWEPQAELVGFTTDASGLVMSGIFRAPAGTYGSVHLPWDMVGTGAGGVGADSPVGIALTAARIGIAQARAPFPSWISSWTTDLEGYGIALKIEGLTPGELTSALFTDLDRFPGVQSSSDVTVHIPLGFQVIGGGAQGEPEDLMLDGDQFITASYPVAGGWRSATKDHGYWNPGYAWAEVTAAPGALRIGGRDYRVEVKTWTATSALSTRPAVTVRGAPGEYALTGIGAAIDWESYGRSGSLLWKLRPRPDIGGAEVAGMDFFWTQPATITGYALGLKLVPR